MSVCEREREGDLAEALGQGGEVRVGGHLLQAVEVRVWGLVFRVQG